jgi:hypothetical protein
LFKWVFINSFLLFFIWKVLGFIIYLV